MLAVKFLTHWLLMPPGVFILVLALLTLWTWRRRDAIRWALLAVTLALYAASIRPVAALLCEPLESAVTPPAEIAADVIVVLGAGAISGVPDFGERGQPSGVMAKSLVAALRLHRRSGLPLLVSGGSPYPGRQEEAPVAGRALLDMGVAEDMVVEETASRNTVENARLSKRIMGKRGWRRALVVCAALHVPRARAIFRREGVDCQFWPSHYRCSAGRDFSLMPDLMPSGVELANVAAALKEYAGLLAVKTGLQ